MTNAPYYLGQPNVSCDDAGSNSVTVCWLRQSVATDVAKQKGAAGLANIFEGLNSNNFLKNIP